MNNELQINYIGGKTINDYTILPYYRFSYNGNSMLLCWENGNTFFITDKLANQIEACDITEELQFKLISRGFASVPGVPEIINRNNCCMPTFFLIDLTNGCNMACSYCFRVPEDKKCVISGEMVINICEYILNHCKKHNICGITIQPWGGEPLLCIDKIVLIRRFFNKYPEINVDICVETNGTLLTEANIRLLKDNQIRYSVSVDGPPDLHDSQRPDQQGRPTADLIKDNIKMAAKYGHKRIGGICILTKRSLGRIRDILLYFENELEMGSIKLNLMRQPSYECENVAPLDMEEIAAVATEIVETLTELRRMGVQIHESMTGDRLQNLTSKRNRNICNSAGCCGGKRMVSFDIQGNIYPCELTDWQDECMGNIADSIDLCEVVNRSLHTKPYFMEKHIDECDSCPWWYYCKGGCSSSIKYRKLKHPCVDEAECQLNKTIYPLLVKKILSRETEMEGWI